MKNHNDESIIALAFGELGESDAAKLKAELADNDAGLDLLAEFSAIKEDLKRLDVPHHQLSTERLRDAILGQGLKPKASFPWRLAWMPAAAAALAVFASQFMPSGQDSGPVAISTTPTNKANALDPSLKFDPVGDLVLESLPDLRDEREPKSSMVGGGRLEARARTYSSNSRGSRSMVTPSRGIEATAKSSSESSGVNTFDTTSSTIKDFGTSEGAAIVLIEKERDTNTGASRAIEVSDPSNVVIGG